MLALVTGATGFTGSYVVPSGPIWLNFMPPNKAMSQQRNAVVIAARYAGRQHGGRLVE